jgi:hypothetical protein
MKMMQSVYPEVNKTCQKRHKYIVRISSRVSNDNLTALRLSSDIIHEFPQQNMPVYKLFSNIESL